ncbi:heterokaryon incompatibility protein-domain-containing protein [Pseudoneurospora amorphoporcata]|uniref:Heterokaryon incompatibility protein-domain-containing protein n=1 Tax=Pseudoneurospora amorphoporcata TaxID=241081 RepID=A0AAN6NMX7_9PEZI|nr:heterokaryon incompatibility protein-domain-containing protein [Pseudoneurospora amorphoporcata]
MDTTDETAESSRSVETSHPPSYEAYIEYCMARFEHEGVPKAAYERLCTSCTAAFKILSEAFVDWHWTESWNKEAPFCSVNQFLRSASEGNCHVCHSLMAKILGDRSNSLDMHFKHHILRAESGEPGVDTPEPGDAALRLQITSGNGSAEPPLTGSLYLHCVGRGKGKVTLADIGIEVKDGHYSGARGSPTSVITARDGSWNQALKWMENCRSHPLCNAVQTTLQDKWPARLVAVGTAGDTYVRVCETSRDGFAKEPYMTLSHCWGKNGVPIRLLEENYARFLDGIQLSELPNTFRDAIELTRKLEIPYIWIDCLCIIQDSPGNQDWTRGSAKMQEVYRNSFLNLAAGASSDSNGGLFKRRYPLSVVPWSVPVAENEQLLARRALTFGQAELHWECSTCQASESFPDSYEKHVFTNLWMMETGIFRPAWENLLNGKLVDTDRQRVWNRLLKTYTRRSLTMPSDRLVAISGLAEQLSSRWSGITYLAGLWSYRLIHGLLWGHEDRLEWIDVLAEALDACVTPKTTTNLFGPVACGGSIKLRSPIIRGKLARNYQRYNLAIEDNGNLGTSTLLIKDVEVKWDDINDGKADLEEVYIAPFEIVAHDSYDWAVAHGLVFLKTTTVHLLPGRSQWPLRRAGYFELGDDYFCVHSEDWFMKGDERVSSDYDSDNGCHDDGSARNRADVLYRAMRWKRDIDKLKRKGLFRDLDSWFAGKVGDSPEERMNYLRKDPYFNGPPLNTNLENRYPPKMWKRLFPHISHFLETIAQVARNNKGNGTPDPVLGLEEGNGYYTYEVV